MNETVEPTIATDIHHASPRTVVMAFLGDRDPFHPLEAQDETGRRTSDWSGYASAKRATTEGDADTNNDAQFFAGPILTHMDVLIARNQMPDRVYILYSYGSYVNDPKRYTEKRVLDLCERLQRRNIDADFWPINAIPVSHAQLLAEMRRAVQKANEACPEARFVVNVSPGTPQMQNVWYSLAHGGILKATLVQTFEGKYADKTGERVHVVNFMPLFESELVYLAFSEYDKARRGGAANANPASNFSVPGMFTRFDFVGVQRVMKELASRTADPVRAKLAEWTTSVCGCYAHWDGFNYGEASKNIVKCIVELEALQADADGLTSTQRETLTQLRERLDAQNTVLRQLVGADVKTTALDMYWAACRTRSTGRFMDCVWRSYTAYEELLRNTLQVRYNEDYSQYDPTVGEMVRSLQDLVTKILPALTGFAGQTFKKSGGCGATAYIKLCRASRPMQTLL